jgi:cholesterol transport system auxiliary component
MRSRVLLVTLLALAGCASGLHSNVAATQVYVLRVASAPGPQGAAKAVAASLQVTRPFAAPGLDSERIVIIEPEHRMSYYAASQWAAPLPDVVEMLVVEKLRASGVWAAVNNSASAFATEYYLQISIRRFEAEYTAAASPTARVSFDCAIGRRASRELIASFTVDGEAVASANRVSSVVAAFEQASNAALMQLAQQSELVLKSPPAPSTP